MKRYISRAPKKPRKSKVLIFLNVVIGILTGFVLLGLITFLADANDNYYTRKFGSASASRDIESGQYAELIQEYQYDRGVIGRVSEGYEEAAAVAEYADAAMRFKAYKESGEDALSAVQRSRMEDAAKRVGIYKPEMSRIDGILSR